MLKFVARNLCAGVPRAAYAAVYRTAAALFEGCVR
jgi:hypothetical protein